MPVILIVVLAVAYAASIGIFMGVYSALAPPNATKRGDLLDGTLSLVWPLYLVLILIQILAWWVRGLTFQYQAWSHQPGRTDIAKEEEPEPIPLRAPAVIPGASIIQPLFEDENDEPFYVTHTIPEVGMGKRRGTGLEPA